jgi:hypothetical protein
MPNRETQPTRPKTTMQGAPSIFYSSTSKLWKEQIGGGTSFYSLRGKLWKEHRFPSTVRPINRQFGTCKWPVDLDRGVTLGNVGELPSRQGVKFGMSRVPGRWWVGAHQGVPSSLVVRCLSGLPKLGPWSTPATTVGADEAHGKAHGGPRPQGRGCPRPKRANVCS